MSETRFNLRRPNTDPAADVESYIDRGAAALPSEKETGIGGNAREDTPSCRTFAQQHASPVQTAGRSPRNNHVRPLPHLDRRRARKALRLDLSKNDGRVGERVPPQVTLTFGERHSPFVTNAAPPHPPAGAPLVGALLPPICRGAPPRTKRCSCSPCPSVDQETLLFSVSLRGSRDVAVLRVPPWIKRRCRSPCPSVDSRDVAVLRVPPWIKRRCRSPCPSVDQKMLPFSALLRVLRGSKRCCRSSRHPSASASRIIGRWNFPAPLRVLRGQKGVPLLRPNPHQPSVAPNM